MYNDTVLDHFANPRNVGSISDADGIGQSGNPVDGDKIRVYIKVNNETLSDVRFKTFGCAAAIAASSMLTVLAIGKSLEEAMKITNDDVAEALGGLPPQKLECSNIAADALHDAIKKYLSKDTKNASIKNEEPLENTTKDFADTNEGIEDSKQIQRYLRHIIMPKISGAGQRKIIDTEVLLCAESIDTCDILLSYMAASGIGHIYCYLENKNRSEAILAQVRDLNPEVNIEIIEDVPLLRNESLSIEKAVDFNIITGSLDFVQKINNLLIQAVSQEYPPTLIAVSSAWQGYLKLCNDIQSSENLLVDITKVDAFNEDALQHKDFEQLGVTMSNAFMGTLVVTELIKARLGIGNILSDKLYFNLIEMLFVNDPSISDCKAKFIQDLFNIDDIKQKLRKAKVLMVGAGGLGSPTAFALAKAGVGTIGLIDFDTVDISNLNRQILHSTSRIGLKKVESAKKTLKMLNPKVNIESYAAAFSKENAVDIIKNYDIIVDGLDNLPTRYLLNDACFFSKKPLIEAGVLAFYGQVTTIVSGDGPCYRCIFPESTEQRKAPSCSETGILGPVAGLAGILEAVEVLKMIIGVSSSLKGGLLMYDALETEFNLVEFTKNNDCKLCGEHPSILELGEYNFVCEDTKK